MDAAWLRFPKLFCIVSNIFIKIPYYLKPLTQVLIRGYKQQGILKCVLFSSVINEICHW